ncbi:hypothetical protein [Paraburkholderia graminis]|uniref:Uncharacterized protein n=1 Tax=Paraburkholderia graminis TaxID=60548 RepID=A0ABD5CSU2_9BURK|nr:hypothetical protein [Paraburkholderia graminis]MDR6208176.1 hypothetical protein [Paraburkholderia graminis]
MATQDTPTNDRATVDQMTQARTLCGYNPFLLAELEEFLNRQPSRAQMYEFIEDLRNPTRQKARFDANILRVCKLVGIDEPTAAEKLLALQIGLQQEQNAALALIASRLGSHGTGSDSGQSQSVFGPLLTGMLLGAVISH